MAAAKRAMEAMSASATRDPLDASRELARRTGTLVGPAELAEQMGTGPVRELARVTYVLEEGGRVPPPARVEVACEPDRLEGVMRSVDKLLESRGWRARRLVGREFAREGVGGGGR